MMRALTLIRPWCWAIAKGHKPWENRGWPPPDSMLGERIALHSGMKWDAEAAADIDSVIDEGHPPSKEQWPGGLIRSTAILRGYIEHDGEGGIVRAVGITIEQAWAYIATHEIWISSAPGFAWLLVDALELKEPVACKGALGLWPLAPATEALVRKQLQEKAA